MRKAIPFLELTLTDAQEKPLARRVFHPAEYLGAGADEALGLAANREMNVKLNLDTTDLGNPPVTAYFYITPSNPASS